MTKKRCGLGMGREMLGNRNLLDLEIDPEDTGNNSVVLARLDNVSTRRAEDLSMGFRISRQAQDQICQVPDEDWLLEKMASAHELKRFAALYSFDELRITTV